MKQPAFELKACEYKDIALNTPVINKHEVEYFVYIYVDPQIAYNSKLYQIDEVTPEGSVPVCEAVIRRDVNCWLRGTTGLMNMTVGQHIYKLSFVDVNTDIVFSLYVSYIIQDDNPDKPYIYMDRKGTSDRVTFTGCTNGGNA